MMGREKGKRIGPIQKREKEQGKGAWCYNARMSMGLTIAELSEKANVSVRTIKRIEAGNRGAGYRSERALRKALGCMGLL